ncbi:Hsp70 family protein [Actinoplanes sp. NPDC023936]|uniref:Hsp70 family protein n=1 Tax=Actinoplanes sp. NPDC023936 TaxID=3154910 RepID=UPI0033EBA08E
MTADYGLGIDLGTTHTAAAVSTGGHVESVRLGARRMEIPSAVFVKDDGELLVGEAAERRGRDEPGRLAREFKRRLGDSVPILAGGMPFSAHALTGKLLRFVLDTVTRGQGGPPARVALTYPAYWGPYKREQLDQAIRLADAGPVRLLSEPEAVARWRNVASGQTVAVYDLGGSGFDVAVLRREGDTFTLLGTPEGVDQLGGGDFDAAVYAHVLGALDGVDLGDPETAPALARLRRDCVEAKESLSFDTEVTVAVAVPGRHTRVRISRSVFEGLIALPVRDTADATRRALRSAGVTADDLSGILLAGGSSRIPLVRRVLADEFGPLVAADAHPELSVALGAASISRRAPAVADSAGPASAGPASAGPASAGTGKSPVDEPSEEHVAASRGSAATAGAASEISRRESAAVVSSGGPRTETAATEPAGGSPGAPGAPALGATTVPAGSGATTVPAGPGSPVPGEPAAAAPDRPRSPAERLGLSLRGPEKLDFTDLRTPVDPWAAAEAEAAARAAEHQFGGVSGDAAPAVPSQAVEPGTQFIAAAPGADAAPGRRPPVPAMAGFVVMIVVSAVAGVAISSSLSDAREGEAAGPGGSASAAGPGGIPEANLVIRVDTGGPMGSASWQPTIQTLNAATGKREPLTGTEPGDTLPRWSNDRSMIALTHRNPDRTNEIYVMDRDGGNRRKLVGGVTGGRVVWSPDNRTVAYVKVRNGVPQIFTMPIDGGPAEQITVSANDKDDPVWTPDGKSIIYWAKIDGVRSLWKISVSGVSDNRAVTDPGLGDAVDPAISPDGSLILFTRKIDDNYDIWSVEPDGSNAKPVTSDATREMDPTWSPDGTWLAYVRGDLNHPAVVIERADGADEQTLTTNGAREGHPCWF